MDIAFETAREADSTVKLFYNDYDIFSDEGWTASKTNAVYQMIQSMKNRNIPIDGMPTLIVFLFFYFLFFC